MLYRMLKVKEVAEILSVSQMTVIRLCRDGRLPFTLIGTMRRIREVDLEYYLLNPHKKPRSPEPERPVYDGLPPEFNGFESNEKERNKYYKEQSEKLGAMLDAKKAAELKAPEPTRQPDAPYTGQYPTGFNQTETQHSTSMELEALLGMYDEE